MFRWQQPVFGGVPLAMIILLVTMLMGVSAGSAITSLLLGFISGTLLLLAVGLRKIPVGSKALKIWLGARQADRALSEGWQWWWPKPLGELLEVDCRVKNLDIPLDQVLTSDKVGVEMKVSLSYHIGASKGEDGREPTPEDWAEALNRYANVGEDDFNAQLKQEAAEKFRAAAAKVTSEIIHTSKDDIVGGAGGNGGVKGALREKAREFGANIKEVQIANITLPPEMVAAANQQKAEQAQKIAEATEREGIGQAIDYYKSKGLPPAEAARLHAVERRKITETVQTVNIPGIETVGSLIAAAIASRVTPKNEEESK